MNPTGRKTIYELEYNEKLIDLMQQGLTNNQIASRLGISESTFYNWLQDNEYFKEAYQIGDARRFDFLMEQGDRIFLTGQYGPNDKGYKHWQKKMSYIYKNYSPEANEKGNTTIQIGNMNVLNQKSDSELIEILEAKMKNLKIDIVDVKLIEGKKDGS